MKGEMNVEIVLRKDAGKDIDQFRLLVADFIALELDDRVIISVPSDWVGFRSGLLKSMMREFGRDLYIALAYTASDGEVVTDIDGGPAQSYSISIDGRQAKKYVKKKLRIVSVIDRENNVFEVQKFIISFNTVQDTPVVKLFSLYSGGPESGVSLSDFLE